MPRQVSAPREGVVVARGFGIKIYVERGHLVVHDGVGNDRQTRRFNRAVGRPRRVVVLGQTGYVTLEALRWLRDLDAALVQLDATGRLVASSTAQTSSIPALRRAQALAAATAVGVKFARDILRDKLDGQAAVAGELDASAQHAIAAARDDLTGVATLGALVALEAAGAAAYWDAWGGVLVRFGAADAKRVPEHWLTFGRRHSPLSRSPRLAANPANAILNYLYALLEVETTLACHVVGLDPGIGIFHTDRGARSSLALDLMEATRPTVDAYLLSLLTQRSFKARDFIETRRGACRLHPEFARELAHTTATWSEHVAPVVERAAQTLADNAAQPLALPTSLTSAARVAAWDDRRRNTRPKRTPAPRLPATCRQCGAELPNRRRRVCDACIRQRTVEIGDVGRPIAAAMLERLRAEGHDPAHGGEAARERGRKNAAHHRANAQWDSGSAARPDPRVFEREVLPRLRRLDVGELVAATGLSSDYCSLIRLGKRVPHPRHWHALRSAGAV